MVIARFLLKNERGVAARAIGVGCRAQIATWFTTLTTPASSAQNSN